MMRVNLPGRSWLKGPIHVKRRLIILSVILALLITALLNAGWFLQQFNYYTLSQSDITKAETVALTTRSDKSEISIPSINVTAPVVDNQPKTDVSSVKNSLQNGVLLYGNSVLPGKVGNVVLVGHSSGSALNPGEYKWVFTLLDRLKPGDSIIVSHGGHTFFYTVDDSRIVKPDDTSVLTPTNKATLTLITCTPVGTNTDRLIVRAHLNTTHKSFSRVGSY